MPEWECGRDGTALTIAMSSLTTTTITTHASSIPSTLMGKADATRAFLHFTSGLLRGQDVALLDETVVGRKRGLPVCLPPEERRVSAEHALLRRSPAGTWVVQDLGSKRGVYLNGERVPVGARPIVNAGDTITFGKGGPSAVLSLRSGEYRDEVPTRYAITLALVGSRTERFHFECRPLVSIGRGRECDVRIDARAELAVSRNHARIRFAAQRFSIEDLQSEAGTLVNGERITSAQLDEGDIVELGPGGPRLVVESIVGTPRRGPSDASVVALVEDIAGKRDRWRTGWLGAGLVGVLAVGALAWTVLDEETAALDDRVASLQERAQAPAPPTIDEVFREMSSRYEPAMLLVRTSFTVRRSTGEPEVLLTGDTFGSGFLLSTEGHAITNRHVLEPWYGDPSYAADLADFIAEYGEDGVVIDATTTVWPAGTRAVGDDGGVDESAGFSTTAGDLRILGTPPRFLVDAEFQGAPIQLLAPNSADLALLQLDGYEVAPERVPRLAPAEVEPAPLDHVMSLGFPHGRGLLERGTATVSPTTGKVRKVEETLQLAIATYPGNSGGPVLDGEGRVLGVTTRAFGEGLGVAIPAAKIVALIEHLQLSAVLPSQGA